MHSGGLAAPGSIQQVLARADGSSALPRLGGMARPNGVVIVSERYWAFASIDGELSEGTMPSRRGAAARTPLLRGLLQLAASVTPLVRGRGVARGRERLLLLAALVLPFFLFALPERYELPTGAALTILLIAWL